MLNYFAAYIRDMNVTNVMGRKKLILCATTSHTKYKITFEYTVEKTYQGREYVRKVNIL